MKQYKGKYIDGVFFHNEAEVDLFLKEQAIASYQRALEIFLVRKDMTSSRYADEKADRLVNEFGFGWDEIDELEAKIMADFYTAA